MRRNKQTEIANSCRQNNKKIGKKLLSTCDRRPTADEGDVLANIRLGLEQARNGGDRNVEDVFNDLERHAALPEPTP